MTMARDLGSYGMLKKKLVRPSKGGGGGDREMREKRIQMKSGELCTLPSFFPLPWELASRLARSSRLPSLMSSVRCQRVF